MERRRNVIILIRINEIIIYMSATEEWLRYIESRAIMQEYDIKGYSEKKDDENTKDDNEV